MPSPVEQIKGRLGIVEVISGYLKLEKSGVNYRARCPFHNEKTPSFFVSPHRENYHCFGCGKSGDIISFVEEIEGVEFKEALSLLASKAGIELVYTQPKEADKDKDILVAVLTEAIKYYQAELVKMSAVKKYLTERGLTEDTITNFKIGFAPSDWQNVSTHLKTKGFDEVLMEKAGLVIKGDPTKYAPGGRYYDRFRGRIMFPIYDAMGKPVGFSGRIFSLNGENEKEAKYVNSPATVLYDKSKILYGYDLAKLAIRRLDFCILVEGQMDLIMSHQAGLTNTVAVSGTAFSPQHAEILKKVCTRLVMAFDADSAGISASKRAVNLALQAGLEVRIVKLPAGQDPADVILKDPNLWSKLVEEQKHVVDFYLAILMEKIKDTRLLAGAIRDEVYPYIAKLAYAVDQAYFIRKISSLLNIPEEAIWTDLRKTPTETVTPNMTSVSVNQKVSKTRAEIIEEKIFGLLFWFADKQKMEAVLADTMDHLKSVLAPEFQNRFDHFALRRQELSMMIDVTHQHEGAVFDPQQELMDLIKQLEIEQLKYELDTSQLALKRAEVTRDEEEIDKLIKKCQTISQKINQLKK